MLVFIAAVYNEEIEIKDFTESVIDYVDYMYFCDDGSTDNTANLLNWWGDFNNKIMVKVIPHTGLPETVKNEALKMVPDNAWVLMLDADERLSEQHLKEIRTWVQSEESNQWDYVYFDQYEIINGEHVRTFQKCKLFKKEAITFPLNNIHADDQFEGQGFKHSYWTVMHRKTSYKQIKREEEYLETYKKLLDEGKIDQGRYEWLCGLHHFVKPT
jgi:glycosyltransferase involved in cell wall biosynthesis